MCGIVGFTGSPHATEYVIEGLKRLEYRGYDSAGIATLQNGDIVVRRKKGKLTSLVDLLKKEPLKGHIAIGHTRWATHGKPTDENAHPHHVDDIVLVHNGIIENFLELRAELEGLGKQMRSETDTEIVAHLIALVPGKSLLERVQNALKRIQGAYALVILSTKEPDTLIAAKNASPMIVGIHPHAGMVASDITALLPHTREVLVLNEGELAVLKPGSMQLYNADGAKIQRPSRVIEWSTSMAEKEGHKHFMHKEIHEQPRAITNSLTGRLHASGHDVTFDNHIIEALCEAKHIVFTACGTSYYASLLGRLALEEMAKLGCEVELASELRYRHPLFSEQSVMIAVSQSGETADTLAAIKAAKAKGCKVLSIVNVIDSSISRESDWTIYTHAGPEIGVASTKAFSTQVMTLLLLAIGVARHKKFPEKQAKHLLEEIRQIPLLIETCLQEEPQIVKVAQFLQHSRSVIYLGRGYGYPVALEGALKLKEISYIHAEGYAAGEMKHGPIALVDKHLPVVCIVTQGAMYDKMISNIQEIHARDGQIIAIATTGDKHIGHIAKHVLYIPKVSPILSPLLTMIPLQLLAYHVADLKGQDVDQPRNLAKSVTVE